MNDTFDDDPSQNYKFNILQFIEPQSSSDLNTSVKQKGYLYIPNEISSEKMCDILKMHIKGCYLGSIGFTPKAPNKVANIIESHVSKQESSYFAIKFNGTWLGITIEPSLKRVTYFDASILKSDVLKKFNQLLNNNTVVPTDFIIYRKVKEKPIKEPGPSAVYTLLDLVGRSYKRNNISISTKVLRKMLMMEIAEAKEEDIIKENVENVAPSNVM